MHTTTLATFFEISRTMCAAGVLIFLIALWAARTDIAQGSGLDKIVALSNMCFAIPLAVFGALHLARVDFVLPLVPKYMPGRLFWAYFVGFALLSASLSIATKILVRWSGLLLGIMMFAFVAMMDIWVARAHPGNRLGWTYVLRELAFGGGGWLFAGSAMREADKKSNTVGRVLIAVGRVLVGMAAVFYGIQNFRYPLNVPGVPLEMMMPTWIPGRLLIGYVTAVILFVAGACILLAQKTRMAATYLGTWIVLLVLLVYGPIMVVSLANPSTGVKVEGINYFADTLLFGGAVLAVASATARRD
jgi:uncharacterized membrane protein YphA (DoxX/SURF4 family)